MARTYDEVLAATLAAMPTPAINWYLHRDRPHTHDEEVVARCDMEFDGVSFVYEAHLNGPGAHHTLKIKRVYHEEAQRGSIDSALYTTWAALVAALAREFEEECELIRTYIATEVQAREVLADAGLTLEPIRLLSLSSGVAGALSPDVDGNYAYETTVGYDTLTVEADEGATITWTSGEVTATGDSYAAALVVGENVITITVTALERLTQTHTVTITKTA